MYHYSECGLPNIHLANGYNKEIFEGEECVGIDDVDALHRVISRCLVQCPQVLSRHEFKFLRIELDLAQKALGSLLGVDAQTIARWEKGQTTIPRTSDVALRVYYTESMNEQSSIGFLLKMLADSDAQNTKGKIVFEAKNAQWQQQQVAA